jgi:hypothetical protein
MTMRILRRSRFGLLLVVAVATAVVAAPAAFAQDHPSDRASAQNDPHVSQSGFAGGIPSGGATDPGGGPSAGNGAGGGLDGNIGALPFTGVDLIIILGVALVLTGAGLTLRRLSIPRETRF